MCKLIRPVKHCICGKCRVCSKAYRAFLARYKAIDRAAKEDEPPAVRRGRQLMEALKVR